MQSITEKNYRKLTLKVSLSGFSFALTDMLSNKVLVVDQISFSEYENPDDTEQCYRTAFFEFPILNQKYDQILVLHANNLSTFVPTALFDTNALESYLQYSVKTFVTDFFTFDTLEKYPINHVYIPYININNVLFDFFSTFDYKHHSSVLVEKLLELSKNDDDKQMFVHFEEKSFEVIVIQNQKLLFFNSFDFSTKEDFAYYLLFTAEQLKMNPEFFTLKLLGNIAEEGEIFEIAYTYVRNVSLLDVSYLTEINGLEKEKNITHFALVQS